MTNKAKPEVRIMLDRERTLVLDLNAMCAFEEATGKNMLKGMESQFSAADLRALLWACLRHEDKSLTLEQVGGMIHGGNMEEISARLMAAWELAVPTSEKGAEDVPLAGMPPAGSTSGPSDASTLASPIASSGV